MASFGTAPNKLLSTVIRLTAERHPELTGQNLVDRVMTFRGNAGLMRVVGAFRECRERR